MPKKFHNYYDYEAKQYELLELLHHEEHIDLQCKFFYNDIYLVFGGRFLKYAFLEEDKGQYSFEKQKNGEVFIDFAVQFMETDEIIGVLETDEKELKWL